MQTLFEKKFPADTTELAAVRSAVATVCAQAGCSRECSENLVLAINEACMNIIQHGYRFAAGQEFCLRMVQDGPVLLAQLLDNGRRVALSDLRPRELDDLRPGGLGVRFMQEVTDAVVYLEPPAGYNNFLQLSKRID